MEGQIAKATEKAKSKEQIKLIVTSLMKRLLTGDLPPERGENVVDITDAPAPKGKFKDPALLFGKGAK